MSLLGGNAYGIFIHSVQKDSIADDVGLRVGDQILEYNGTDLRRATAEYAAFELAKPADKVTAMVQYNVQSELPFLFSVEVGSFKIFFFQNSTKSRTSLEILSTFVLALIAMPNQTSPSCPLVKRMCCTWITQCSEECLANGVLGNLMNMGAESSVASSLAR